ncbi:MAG: hypothetical protein ACOCQT_02375 [Desulfovermiculus sp.]
MSEKKKKGTYECLADSLAEETLQEAADTFFGQRKSIENEIQIYNQWIHDLAQIQVRVQTFQATLHFVLANGETETVKSFYRAIGVDADQVPRLEDNMTPDLRMLHVPFALRAQNRYVKLLSATYSAFVDQVSGYMYGRNYQDPEDPRRQRVTINYQQVYAFYTQLKEKIHKTNQDNSPTQVLQFVKQLDIERSARESLVGVPLQYTLDEDMAIAAPDFAHSGLKAYPDFPAPDEVKGEIRKFAVQVYAAQPEKIHQVFKTIREG